MTKEKAIKAIKEKYRDPEYIDELIKVLEQEPCDYVSRQAVKELFQEACEMEMYDFLGIDDIPSVTPQPKTEVLDKIRDEIADLDDADYDYEGYYKAVTDALKIIDKYKAESEE